jgi:hypothetical protein
MPNTINILGHQVSKTTAGIVAVTGVGAVGYGIYKRDKEKKAAAAATAATPNSYGYGSSQYSYGYGGPSQYYGYGFGYGTQSGASASSNGTWEYGYGEYGYGYYNSATGAYEGGASGSGTPTPTGAVPTTNSEWVTVAVSDLAAEGTSASTASAALGAYILGQPLTPAQITIVQSAIGLAGDPPQEGTGGYPPSYKSASGSSGGGGQTTPAATVTVPNVVGMRGEDARKAVEAAGLLWKQSPATTPSGKTTTVKTQSPTAGTKVRAANPKSTVTAILTVSK